MVAFAADVDVLMEDSAPGAETHGGGCALECADFTTVSLRSTTRTHRGCEQVEYDFAETFIETGLYYARARMYSAGLGRFIGRDPLNAGRAMGGYHDGFSLYSAYFSPNHMDPFGTGLNNPYPNDKQPKPPPYDDGNDSDVNWKDPAVEATNNCYNYACDNPDGTFKQPGADSGYSPKSLSCEEITKAAKSDGALDYNGKCCPEGYHLVYLVVDPGVDFHWYKKGKKGNPWTSPKWSHKPGSTPATDKDAAGKQIKDPAAADKGSYKNCGYLCLKN